VVKKTPLAAFSRPRPSGIIAMGLDPDDELIGVDITTGSDEIVLGTRNGWAVRFDENDVRAMGRNAHGVRGVDLRGDDAVVDMIVTNENASILTVCQFGYGKRTQVSEYRKTRRGGKGVINIKTTDRNGKVVALKSVVDTDELMIISAKGIALRTDLSELREIGRATQGVRLIRLEEGDEVVAVAKIVREDDEEVPAPSGEAPPAAPGAVSGPPSGETSPDIVEPEQEADNNSSEGPR
jgi:DNA gyrase subunit A